ncbi:ABC transporter substrate-binding protein [Bordetella tumulicola]|uniref:ABC transporter substrate-binding protein n=1 Tax=Bordetella tumulicola TaxID=1649133 RepID=UPI0039F09C47
MGSSANNTSINLSRRRVLQFGAAAVSTVALPGLSLAQTREQATLASGSAGYTWALPFVAEGAGYWKANNVDLRVLDFPTGRDSMQALLAGSANFSTTTDTPLVFAVLRGLKPSILANFSRYSYDMKIVAREGSGIVADQPASIKGKKIGTPAGTSGQYALAKYLEFAKLSTSDVQQVNLAPTDLIGALVRDDIDAFSWTAVAGKAAIRQSGGKAFVLTQDGYEKFFRSHQLLLVNQNTLETRQPLVKDAIAALLAAERRMAQDPTWPALIASRIRSTPEEVKEATAVFEFKLGFDKSFLDDLVTQAKWAIDAKLAPAPAGDLRALFRAVIETAPLQAAAPDRVTLA